eukprot:scaffold19129_cov37-Tisochrysis_lutea.AAC.2
MAHTPLLAPPTIHLKKGGDRPLHIEARSLSYALRPQGRTSRGWARLNTIQARHALLYPHDLHRSRWGVIGYQGACGSDASGRSLVGRPRVSSHD